MKKNFIKLNDDTIVNVADISALSKDGVVFSVLLRNGHSIEADSESQGEAEKTMKKLCNLLLF